MSKPTELTNNFSSSSEVDSAPSPKPKDTRKLATIGKNWLRRGLAHRAASVFVMLLLVLEAAFHEAGAAETLLSVQKRLSR